MRVHEAIMRLKFGETMVRVGLRGHIHTVVKKGERDLYCLDKIWNPSDEDLTSTTWAIRTADESRRVAVQATIGHHHTTRYYEIVDRAALHDAVAAWVDGAIDQDAAHQLTLSYHGTPRSMT